MYPYFLLPNFVQSLGTLTHNVSDIIFFSYVSKGNLVALLKF